MNEKLFNKGGLSKNNRPFLRTGGFWDIMLLIKTEGFRATEQGGGEVFDNEANLLITLFTVL